MKIAAARSLAALAKEPISSEMLDAYGLKELSFGRDYVIPKPLDSRMLEWETPAVAQAAMDTGVATKPITDMDAYRQALRERVAKSRKRINAFVDSYYEK
jgi:malate dehydrogenase (oxaloacetate-decarboxylating)(NADP+)